MIQKFNKENEMKLKCFLLILKEYSLIILHFLISKKSIILLS